MNKSLFWGILTGLALGLLIIMAAPNIARAEPVLGEVLPVKAGYVMCVDKQPWVDYSLYLVTRERGYLFSAQSKIDGIACSRSPRDFHDAVIVEVDPTVYEHDNGKASQIVRLSHPAGSNTYWVIYIIEGEQS